MTQPTVAPDRVRQFLDSPTVRAAIVRTLDGCDTNRDYLADALLLELRELTSTGMPEEGDDHL